MPGLKEYLRIVCAGAILGAACMFPPPGLETGAPETRVSETHSSESASFAGLDEERKIEVQGRQRSYVLHVPGGVFHTGEDVPVIFAAHYYRGSARAMQHITGLDETRAVVVYLQGVGNAWAPSPYAETSEAEDLAYFEAVRSDVLEEFGDLGRVFLAGFSNGGGFAMMVRCRRPELVDGVATVSAAVYEGSLRGCAPVPVPQVDVHGQRDRLIAFEGGVRHGRRYLGVDEVMGVVAGVNGCVSASGEVVPEGIVREWDACLARLRQVRVSGGGHEWGVPGGEDSSPRFATREIVGFWGLEFLPETREVA